MRVDAREPAFPELSLIGDFAASTFSSSENLQTGAHDPQRSGFSLQALALAGGGEVDEHVRFDANLVFTSEGAEVEEVYGSAFGLPLGFGIRAGQFLTRFGRINATHPHAWDFVDQTLVVGRIFGAEGNRAPGIEVSWHAPLPWHLLILASVGNASGVGSARSFRAGDESEIDGPEQLLYVGAVKQAFSLGWGWSLDWGFSGAVGPNATGHDQYTWLRGSDLRVEYARRRHTLAALQAEVVRRDREVAGDTCTDYTAYAQVLWHFTPRWATAARYEYGSPERLATGRPASEPELLVDPEWTGTRHRMTTSITHWPTPATRLRLQASEDVPAWRDDPIIAVFLSAEVVLGIHGAHPEHGRPEGERPHQP